MRMISSSNTTERSLTTAGITVFLVFVCSVFVTGASHYHSMQREGAIIVNHLTSWLELAWVFAAAVFALARWKSTSLSFRVVVFLNALIVTGLLTELFAALLHRIQNLTTHRYGYGLSSTGIWKYGSIQLLLSHNRFPEFLHNFLVSTHGSIPRLVPARESVVLAAEDLRLE